MAGRKSRTPIDPAEATFDDLTDLEKAYVMERLANPTGSKMQAYRKASGNWHCTPSAAGSLEARAPVREVLAREMKAREEQARYDANKLFYHLAEAVTADVADLYRIDGTMRPVHEWPMIFRQLVESVEVVELRGDERGQVTKIKLPSRAKMLETLGRHVDVQAFKDRLELEDARGLDERIREARARAKIRDEPTG